MIKINFEMFKINQQQSNNCKKSFYDELKQINTKYQRKR